jgi:hypothetical protein
MAYRLAPMAPGLEVLGEVDRGHAALAQLALEAVPVGEGKTGVGVTGWKCTAVDTARAQHHRDPWGQGERQLGLPVNS